MPVSKESDINPAFETWKSSSEREKAGALDQLIKLLRRCAIAICWQRAPLGLRDQAVDAAVWRAVQSLEKFNGRSKFSTWFNRIVINEANRVMRRARDSREVPLDETHEEGHNPSAELAAKIQVDILRAGRDDEDAAFLDMVLDGMAFEEIGEVVGISAGAARVRWARMKESLRAD